MGDSDMVDDDDDDDDDDNRTLDGGGWCCGACPLRSGCVPLPPEPPPPMLLLLQPGRLADPPVAADPGPVACKGRFCRGLLADGGGRWRLRATRGQRRSTMMALPASSA